MKILMISTGVFPVPTSRGGAENHVYYLSKSLSERGIEIDLVSDIGNNAEFNGNINTYPINMPEYSVFERGFPGYMLRHFAGGFYAFKKARELLKSNHYDVIHVHGRVAPFLLSLFKNDTPLVFTLHDDPPSKGQASYYIYRISYKLFQETAARRASQIIPVHTKLKEELIKMKINADKISVIPNGVDVNLFKGQQEKEDYEENVILFVGSLTKRKGVNYLLEVISNIKETRLIIVGDGPEMKPLVQQGNQLKINGRVTFMGNINPEDLPNYYLSASIFILPSLREAFPLSILEAMSCNLPVIATNTSGMPEVIKDGYNGFLVEPKNVEQLREKIKLLVKNPCLCREMGKNARKTVEEKYSWDSVARNVINVYENVLGGGR